MKARPILFSGPMVRALLDGSKTQTRRVVKNPQDGVSTCIDENDRWKPYVCDDRGNWHQRPCPYGKVGDLLWVRETWAINMRATDLLKVFYKAHERHSHTEMHQLIPVEGIPHKYQATWPRFKPSIHMPRWASRITLEITGVRVERLQDISEADSLAEGVCDPTGGTEYEAPVDADYKSGPRTWFAMLWARINGIESWRANPWVWVVEFKVHRCNVDELLRQREAAVA